MSANLTKNCSANVPWMLTVLPVSYLIICVLGILFNLFVLVVFCFHKKACTVPEIYLSNLAAADFLLMCSLPFEAVSTANDYTWPFGDALCKLLSVLFQMNSSCSSGFLVLVSVDRYLAVVHPLSFDTMRRPKYAKLGCVLVWTLGFLLSIHNIIYKKTVPYFANNVACSTDYASMTTYVLGDAIITVSSFIISLCIVSFCTVKILKVLRNRVPQSSKTQQMEQKTTTLILAVLLLFLICWLPFYVTKILTAYIFMYPGNNCYFNITVELSGLFSIILAFLNSVLNPLLYVIVGKSFRKKAKELFQQRKNITTTTSLTTGNMLTSEWLSSVRTRF